MSLGSGRIDTDVLADLGYPLYERLFNADGDFVGDLGRKLAQARMPDPVELYLSRALSIGFLVGLAAWLVGTLIGYTLFALGVVDVGSILGAEIYNEQILAVIEAIKVPALVIITGLFFGSVGFGLGFGRRLRFGRRCFGGRGLSPGIRVLDGRVLSGTQEQTVFHDPRLDAALYGRLGDPMQHVGVGCGRLGTEESVLGGEVAKIFGDGLHRRKRVVESLQRARERAIRDRQDLVRVTHGNSSTCLIHSPDRLPDGITSLLPAQK